MTTPRTAPCHLVHLSLDDHDGINGGSVFHWARENYRKYLMSAVIALEGRRLQLRLKFVNFPFFWSFSSRHGSSLSLMELTSFETNQILSLINSFLFKYHFFQLCYYHQVETQKNSANSSSYPVLWIFQMAMLLAWDVSGSHCKFCNFLLLSYAN